MILKRMLVPTLVFIACLLQSMAGATGTEKKVHNEMLLIDFQHIGKVEDWRIVNDGVMGGLSQSDMTISDNNTAVFKGRVSLENNGGFASMRTRPHFFDLEGYEGILLRLKGDGKRYQLRLRTDDGFDGISYRYTFNTETDEWIIIRAPFNECVPVFRGRVLSNVGAIIPKKIKQIGFLIADKQPGPFKIEIDWIKAFKNQR